MAKKIEGCTPDGHYITNGGVGDFCPLTHMPGSGYSVGRQEQHRQATLVIHDGPHEPVYTASEVRAKDQDLKWALTWMKNEAAHLREMGNPQPALETAVDMVIKRHGLSIESDADVMGLHVPKADHA